MSPHHNTNHLKAYFARWLLIFSVIFATCYAVVSICCELASANVLYQGSFWLEALYITRQICHSLTFSALMGFLLYGLYRLDVKECRVLLLATFESLLYLALINLFSYIIVNAAWSPDGMLSLALQMLREMLFEALVLAAFYGLSFLILRTAKSRGEGTYIPYASAFSFRNPMQGSALVGAFLLFLPVLIENVSFDIYYGAPEGVGDWLGLLLYYLVDTLVCLILPYIAILLVCKKADAFYQRTLQ